MLANAVTSIRLLLLPPLFWLLLQHGAPERWGALAVLALAGLTDVVDGRIARALDQVSRLGAMLDLIADRLLTLTVLAALIMSRELKGWCALAAVVLIARDLVVASFGEAAPALQIKVTALERVKIALQFAAYGLLAAPPVLVPQYAIGEWALAGAAGLACGTVAGYAQRVGKAL
jgi:phosphatidylglycerophosphate synthase